MQYHDKEMSIWLTHEYKIIGNTAYHLSDQNIVYVTNDDKLAAYLSWTKQQRLDTVYSSHL
jgi:hypothetical protein